MRLFLTPRLGELSRPNNHDNCGSKLTSTQRCSTASPNSSNRGTSANQRCSFGQQLRTSLLKDYYYYYIAYEDLKDALKTPYETAPTPDNTHPNRRPWNEDDEKAFVAELEAELDKVWTFQRVKSGEIVRRIKTSEKEVNEVIARLERRGPRRRSSQNGIVPVEEDDIPTEDDFMLLEEDLSDVIADVHDLAKFTQLNYTGFQKIIKKHDVNRRKILNSKCGSLADLASETNAMAPQTSFRRPTESKTLFSGQL